MSRIRMTTLSFLLLALSPFVISDSDYVPRPYQMGGGDILFLGRIPLASASVSVLT